MLPVIKEKYFTPNIEELHIGYELEWKCKIRNQDWKKEICDVDLISIIYDAFEHVNFKEPFNEQFRVPYLNKEQIENEGFKCYQDNFLELYFRSEEPDGWIEISYDLEFHAMNIERIFYQSNTTTDSELLFMGKIKCINEFRNILKYLNIKA